MDRPSKPVNTIGHKYLRIEELEERIAPVVVDADNSANPWILGTMTNGWGAPDQSDEYWIFYVGPGQADIKAADGTDDINGKHIGDITITGSDETSALFIMDFPNDPIPSADVVPWLTQFGTISVDGVITVDGDMGYIAIDGMVNAFVDVAGNLGKFDVGAFVGTLQVHGDLYEFDVDSTLGASYDEVNGEPDWHVSGTSVLVDGNIGAIRVGVGLEDQGESPLSLSIVGGLISSTTYIRANADDTGAPGVIDLIEVKAGAVSYEEFGGYLGSPREGGLPRLSAGHGGNIHFITVDGGALWLPPQGSTTIPTITVTSSSPAMERTIVDDSGGVMTIQPQDVTFTLTDGSTVTYLGSVSYLIIPVDIATQGPGSVVARLTANGSNTFNVTGVVDVGDFRMGSMMTFTEGLQEDLATLGVASIDDLVITSAGTLSQLTGFAHETITGPGECDVYLVNASTLFGAGGERTIPIFQNNTHDGDIVTAAADTQIVLLSASKQGGDIGGWIGVSGHPLKGPLYYNDGDIAWVDAAEDTATAVAPFGIEGSLTRYNAINGVLSDGKIYGISTGGAIGDVRAPGADMVFIQANSNNVRDPGSPFCSANTINLPSDIMPAGFFSHSGHEISPLGKAENSVGDGIFGKVFSGTGQDFPDSLGNGSGGGNIVAVRVGEGLQDSEYFTVNLYPLDSPYPNNSGVYGTSGVFTGSLIESVSVSGSGRYIFGDILGGEINTVAATNGAAIDGPWIGAVNMDHGYVGPFAFLGDVNRVIASGTGAYIAGANIRGNNIGSVVVSGGHDSTGLTNSVIWAGGGGLDTVSAGGAGIDGSIIQASGTIHSIRTPDADGVISNTDIEAISGLGLLDTHSLTGDHIHVLTVGRLSTLDYIQDTVFEAGGLRKINVKNDIFTTDGALVRTTLLVSGPIDSVTVGGNIVNSVIESTGFFGEIKSINVKGGIFSTDLGTALLRTNISSTGVIGSIKAGAAGIEANILAEGLETGAHKAGKLKVTSGGDVSGTWELAHRLENLTTKGSVNADITALSIGTIKAAGGITGTINTPGAAGDIGKITAVDSITGDISAGGSVGTIASTGRSIQGSIAVTGDLKAVKAAVDVGTGLSTISVGGNLGTVSAGSTMASGDVLCDVVATGDFKKLAATGNVTGAIDVGGDLRSVNVGNAVTDDVNVAGDLGTFKAGGDVGGPLTDFNVGGSLGSLTVGSRSAAADMLADVNVTVNLGTMNVSGNFPGSLFAGGNAGTVKTGLQAGDPGDTFTVGGNLGSLVVGYISRSDLLAEVDVTGNSSRINVGRADIFADINIGGNMGTITLGRIDHSITIGGNLSTIVSFGSIFYPGIGAVDADIWFDGTVKTGELIVTGEIKNDAFIVH
jgi:hypothetical protein